MRFTFVFMLIGLLSINSFAQRTLTLDEAVKIALQRNTLLQRGTNDIEGTRSSVKSAYGALLPTLDVRGQWDWNRRESESGSTINIDGNPFTLPGATEETRSFRAQANASITLFDGLSNFASISRSKNNLESARLNLERLKQDIVFGTISRYYSVLNARELVKVREDDLAYNQKNLETISERNKLGAVTMADVYAQQVRVGNSELALIQAKNDYDNFSSQLLSYLGVDVLEQVSYVDPLDDNGQEEIEANNMLKEYEDISLLVDQATNNRTDLKGAQLALAAANNGITVAQSGYFPQLTNNYSFSLSGNKLDEMTDNRNYAISLSLYIPIFNGWLTETSVQLAEVTLRNQEVTIDELERDIKINLKNTYLTFQAAQKKLAVSENNVLSAEQNRQIQQEKYNLGAVSLVDLLITISEYTTAQQNLINSRYEFFTLKSQLEYYLGVLDYKKYE